MQPMGIVVLGGLLLGTLVTLVLIPCFYCIVKRIKFTDKTAPVVQAEVQPSKQTETEEQASTAAALDTASDTVEKE